MMWDTAFLLLVAMFVPAMGMNSTEKAQLRDKVKEMFQHAYNSYMTYAYPADELMPLSCQGRYRGSHRSRGDVDDALGNFSLTLIDSLDTLAVIGELKEFENSVKRVITEVSFDRDIVVSVFETNIRVVGGLLGGHVMSRQLQRTHAPYMSWYNDQLLTMAADVARRLLPAFNTTTGIPYPRVNLQYGLTEGISRAGKERDTCTACAGTIILEFAALSRLTGEPVFEEKAKKAMAYLWKQRHRVSDLMGTVINIHNGDWVRRDSGVGAGIDSYYEYLLKAYVLLGDQTYYDRFTKHYDAVMRYMNHGPMLVDVHMHRPTSTSRHFMDSLQAFWPGLQVLHGDIKPAIELHEMLYQLVQRHNFLPEAFTTDFRIHWAHHPLRPEFLESTYFLYKATGDDHYLEVGKTVLENLDRHGRVECGFAAIKDVTTLQHDDQMDSYVLAETFKYLWLLFSEPEDNVIDVDDYVFTTEAHLLPLTLSMHNYTKKSFPAEGVSTDLPESLRSCPSATLLFPDQLQFASTIRQPLKNYVTKICPKPSANGPGLRARDFVAGNTDQLQELRRMGIKIVTMPDGRVQLLHTASEAASPSDADEGMVFMQEMIELSKQQQEQQVTQDPVHVQLLSVAFFGSPAIGGGPAQFGVDLRKETVPVKGRALVAEPYDGCSEFTNSADDLLGAVVVVQRGGCLFIDKARRIQESGGLGVIVIDNNIDSSFETSMLFSMSGDGKQDVTIPMVFLFSKEGSTLLKAIETDNTLHVALTGAPMSHEMVMKEMMERLNNLEQDVKRSDQAMKPETPTVFDRAPEAHVTDANKSATQLPGTQSQPFSPQGHPTGPITPEGQPDATESKGHPTPHEPSTTIDVDGVQIKIRGQHRTRIPENTPGVEALASPNQFENKLRLDIDRLFEGRSRRDLQYEEVTHKILNLLSETLIEFGQEENEDYINAVKSMVEAAVQTMDIGVLAPESENDSEEQYSDRVLVGDHIETSRTVKTETESSTEQVDNHSTSSDDSPTKDEL